MQILLANPRGFCAGVDRAISIVENALAIYGAPIYVRHEVVHNRYVVDSLRERGAIFIEQISEVPDGAILIFSAHGVSQAVRNEAKSRDLTVFDATCPLVTKVHMEVARASRRGKSRFSSATPGIRKWKVRWASTVTRKGECIWSNRRTMCGN